MFQHLIANGSRVSIDINKRESLIKLFSPSSFSGENFIAYRHFKKVPSKSGKKVTVSMYNGRSTVNVLANNTAFSVD